MLLMDILMYLGFSIYSEKHIDKEIIKDAEDQEVLDIAYQKNSPNHWP